MTYMSSQQFSEVGCRSCGKGGNWKFETDGEGRFRATHSCGHVSKFEIVDKPDERGISMRFFL